MLLEIAKGTLDKVLSSLDEAVHKGTLQNYYQDWVKKLAMDIVNSTEA